ncbi:DNA gyrase C-terminal beta-propeller domain-containing protein [Paraflavitalea speifideaquila]|uniref:DNA gyrase C-terminal beta-propeller domain-containing protein n=1 Tax=Paraflavitalea speifideaquila TaxID=3076558 RepID=UPI0028E5E8B5|nr:DNA gyrase C-terminal beta-propeller domain-containing protein [Paraflavitalea speifideiaquila]
MICVGKEDKSRTVLVVSEKGYGKRTQIDEYRITNRGGKGVKTITVTDKTGPLVGILDVTEKEDLMITCRSGVTIRMPIKGVSEQGRATQGVKLIRLNDGDEIAAITKLDEDDEETEAVVIAEGGTEPIIEETAADEEGLNAGEEPTGDAETASGEETNPS